MKIIQEFTRGDGAHWGLTDWYPEKEAALRAAFESGEPFDTGWYGSKKEIASARIRMENGTLKIEVSVSDDDDTEGHGRVERALPCTMDDIAADIDKAWGAAIENQKDNWDDPNDYIGMGWVGQDGRP